MLSISLFPALPFLFPAVISFFFWLLKVKIRYMFFFFVFFSGRSIHCYTLHERELLESPGMIADFTYSSSIWSAPCPEVQRSCIPACGVGGHPSFASSMVHVTFDNSHSKVSHWHSDLHFPSDERYPAVFYILVGYLYVLLRNIFFQVICLLLLELFISF